MAKHFTPPTERLPLVQRQRQAQREALLAALLAKRPALVAWLAGRYARLNRFDAEDLVLAGLASLDLSEIRDSDHGLALLRRSVDRAAIDELRRRYGRRRSSDGARRAPEVELEAVPEGLLAVRGADDEAHERVGGDATATAVAAALEGLCGADRCALTLRFGAGLPVRDVGEALGVSPSSAARRAVVARERLLEHLAARAPSPSCIATRRRMLLRMPGCVLAVEGHLESCAHCRAHAHLFSPRFALSLAPMPLLAAPLLAGSCARSAGAFVVAAICGPALRQLGRMTLERLGARR